MKFLTIEFYIIFINILSDYFFCAINNLSDNMNKIAIDEETGKITLYKTIIINLMLIIKC